MHVSSTLVTHVVLVLMVLPKFLSLILFWRAGPALVLECYVGGAPFLIDLRYNKNTQGNKNIIEVYVCFRVSKLQNGRGLPKLCSLMSLPAVWLKAYLCLKLQLSPRAALFFEALDGH
jgi:hypothetical protein